MREGFIRFQFGDTKIAVETSDPRLSNLVKARYNYFRTDEDPNVVVTFDVTTDMILERERLYEARHQVPVVTNCADGTTIDGLHFKARLRDGSVCIEGPRATYPIDLTLALLWQLNHPHGFILHGAGLLDGCRGWIASGPSGCGKSTLAGLVPEHALCDEYVGVVLQTHGFELVGLPFWTGRPGFGSLNGVHFLVHGRDHKVTALTEDQAWPALRRQIVWPMHDSAAAQRALNLGLEVARSVPCFELQFAPDIGVWNYVRMAQ